MAVVSRLSRARWSLPLTWILLALVMGLVYFFGRVSLLYVVGTGVLIGVVASLLSREGGGTPTSAEWLTRAWPDRGCWPSPTMSQPR